MISKKITSLNGAYNAHITKKKKTVRGGMTIDEQSENTVSCDLVGAMA